MPIFHYTARDENGKLVQGTQEADDESSAVRQLQAKNLLVTKVVPAAVAAVGGVIQKPKKKHRKVKPEDMLFFVRQTATLLEAGIPLFRAIDIISEQVDSETLQKVIGQLKDDIRAGTTLKEAIAKNPKVFPRIWVFLIEAGEASGNLPLVLHQLADNQEAAMNLRKKIVTAMVYPSVVILVAIVAVLVFLLKVIPIFAQIFDDFGAELPPLTKGVILVSNFFQKTFLFFLAGFFLSGYLFKKYASTQGGRRSVDAFVLRLPIFGEFAKDTILARIAINFSTLIASGVNLLKSIEITSHASGNTLFETALNNASLDVQQGKPLSAALAQSPLFPAIMIHMIRVGEESGKVPDMMAQVGKYYTTRVDVFVSRLGTLIEPAILVIIGGIVGVLVIAMFLPIFNLGSVIN
jgi:type IV pilus assembly protein PilC